MQLEVFNCEVNPRGLQLLRSTQAHIFSSDESLRAKQTFFPPYPQISWKKLSVATWELLPTTLPLWRDRVPGRHIRAIVINSSSKESANSVPEGVHPWDITLIGTWLGNSIWKQTRRNHFAVSSLSTLFLFWIFVSIFMNDLFCRSLRKISSESLFALVLKGDLVINN